MRNTTQTVTQHISEFEIILYRHHMQLPVLHGSNSNINLLIYYKICSLHHVILLSQTL